MPRKICVVITARPSYSRIRTALEAIRAHPDLELQLVIAASALLDRYGNAINVIESEGFKVDRKVYMIVEGENLVTSAKSTGFGLAELSTVFDDLRPDAVITIADRFETIATAIAAAYMNIPLVHIQGGEVTGSIDEKVRHAVTKLADVHLVSSDHAATRVISMGERPESVFVTGCPSIDLAREAREAEPRDIDALLKQYGGVGADVDVSNGYIVVMQHPVTTEFGLAQKHVLETLTAVREGQFPTLWFWPNVDAGSDQTSKSIRAFREHHAMRNVHFYKNMKPLDFLSLLINSRGIVGNSSVAIRECAYLGVPAVNIGSRQSGRDRGRNVIDVDYDHAAIREAITTNFERTDRHSDLLYGDGTAGEQIADVLAKAELTIEKRLTY
ncbi:MAG: UDP-N-acetylglucosamine 2-epimerase (hydrolyzing) [Hyphomicrobiales bacterium]|nr:MAG: UDP-N-acetylglucosamine 2-epimerase (hydrolyzing) [Hyphomicrobiales bacterium]